MTDFSRFLPLSRRLQGDEQGVSSDRRAALADVVDHAAKLVATDGQGRAVFAEAFVDDAGLREDYDAFDTEMPSAALVSVASAIRSGRRRRIRALVAGARALLLLGRDLEVAVELAPATAGAVALYLAGSGPFDRRAVIKGHQIRATDAEWSFGSGPTLEATATGVAAFLLGISDDPPHPPPASSGR
jgi:hypothetical protein